VDSVDDQDDVGFPFGVLDPLVLNNNGALRLRIGLTWVVRLPGGCGRP
jgi:hypothetical protein